MVQHGFVDNYITGAMKKEKCRERGVSSKGIPAEPIVGSIRWQRRAWAKTRLAIDGENSFCSQTTTLCVPALGDRRQGV